MKKLDRFGRGAGADRHARRSRATTTHDQDDDDQGRQRQGDDDRDDQGHADAKTCHEACRTAQDEAATTKMASQEAPPRSRRVRHDQELTRASRAAPLPDSLLRRRAEAAPRINFGATEGLWAARSC